MIAMREFLWVYFCRTGVIDAYMLYKECGTAVRGSQAFQSGQKNRSRRGRGGALGD